MIFFTALKNLPLMPILNEERRSVYIQYYVNKYEFHICNLAVTWPNRKRQDYVHVKGEYQSTLQKKKYYCDVKIM